MNAAPNSRYHSAAIVLHWVMAIAFILMLASGLTLEYAPLEKQFKFQLFQWHKSLGVLLIAAVMVRIAVRLACTPPPLPAHFKLWEQRAAWLGHAGLYAMMIVMPFSGWLLVSSSSYGLPTIVFGLFEWPHLPGIAGSEAINDIAAEVHEIGAFAFLFLLAAHIGAVIKHAAFDRENLLRRMWWGKANHP